jgi:hypothetical protein
MAITMKNAVYGMLRSVGLVRTVVSEELKAFIIRVTRIAELGRTSAVSSNRRTANIVPSSLILVTLIMEALRSSKSLFLQEPHGLTSQKTTFFILTAVTTSNLT